MSLLVEADLEGLNRGGALSRDERPGCIFCRDEVGRLRIARLEKRPVRVELEGDFQPRAVCDAAGTNNIVENDLLPGARDDRIVRTAQCSEKRKVLGIFPKSCGNGLCIRRRGTAVLVAIVSQALSPPWRDARGHPARHIENTREEQHQFSDRCCLRAFPRTGRASANGKKRECKPAKQRHP
jgi:hypothetical protein